MGHFEQKLGELLADELDTIELIIAAEKEFGLQIDDDGTIEKMSVSQFAGYLENATL